MNTIRTEVQHYHRRSITVIRVSALLLLAFCVLLSFGCGKKGDGLIEPPPVPPKVTSAYPADSARAVKRNSIIFVTFSKGMKRTETQGAFSANTATGTFLWFGNTMLFVPGSPFGVQETVRVSVTGNAQDLEGNGLTPTFQRWFITGDSVDTIIPTITYQSPAPGAANQPVGTTITLKTSEPVLPFFTGGLVLRDSLGNSVAGNTAWQDSVTVQFIPAANLAYSARYTVMVDTILRDLCWNANDTISWWFQTEGDTVRPTVVSISPGNGSSNVSLKDSIIVDFSEPMDTAATRAAFTVAPAVTGSVTWPTASRMKIKPAQVLAVKTSYAVTLGNGARDLSGNQLASPYNSGFTTDRAVYAACQGANYLYIMAAFSGQEMQRIALTGPSDVRVSSSGQSVYIITNGSPGNLYVLDAWNAHVVSHTVGLQNQPFCLDISANRTKLLASNYTSNSLSIVDTLTWTASHFGVDLGPRGAAFGNSNNIIVACAGAGVMYSYPAAGGSWQYNASVHSGSQRLTLSGTRDTVYLCEGDQASAFAASDFTWYGSSEATISCYDIVRVGNKLYVSDPDNNLVRVYLATPVSTPLTPITTIAVGSRPMGLGLSGDKSLLYVANYTSGTVSVISLATDAVTMTMTVGANPVAVAATP